MPKFLKYLASCLAFAAALCILELAEAGRAIAETTPEVQPELPSGEADRGEILPASAVHTVLTSLDRAGPRIVAVGELATILISEDEGRNWRRVPVESDVTFTRVRFADSLRGWIIGQGMSVFHTSDGGASWIRQHQAPEDDIDLRDVTFLDMLFLDRAAGEILVVGSNGYLLRTDDGGKSWETQMLAGDEFDPHLYAIAQIDRERLVAAGERGALFYSQDRGASWSRKGKPYEGTFFGLVAPREGQVIAYAMLGNVFVSHNFGDRWTRLETGLGDSALGHYVSDDELVLAGLTGGFVISRDGGESFSSLDLPRFVNAADVLRLEGGEYLTVGAMGIFRASLSASRDR